MPEVVLKRYAPDVDAPLVQGNVESVRALWRRWERQGLDAMLDGLPDDVEWVPLAAGGRTFRGKAELRAYVASVASAGAEQRVHVYSFEARGDNVLVTGSLRESTGGGFRESQPAWVGFFDEDRLVRAQGYASRADAEAAIAAARSVATG